MDSDLTRQLSSEVFQRIKPYCQKVSELTQAPNTANPDDLVYALRQVSISLSSHVEKYVNSQNGSDSPPYIISTKLSDYIFFPLSNLLKNPSLPDPVVQYILEILAFLTQNSWRHDIDSKMLDQLLGLCVFLSGGSSASQRRDSAFPEKNPAFVAAVASCLVALLQCVPRDYYTPSESLQKRLSLLGDATTVLLHILEVSGSGSEPVNISILHCLAGLYSTRVTAEQTSFVFPGIVSKVINYHTKSKNMSSQCLLAVLELLGALIVRVFFDSSLEVSITEEAKNLDDIHALSGLLERSENTPELDQVPFKLHLANTEGKHRTQAWLEATSKQLKISLMIFMKNFILDPRLQARLSSNSKLADGVYEFMTQIVRNCFKALFREMVPGLLDISSALFHVLSNGKPDSLQNATFFRISDIFSTLSRTDMELFYEVIQAKIRNLASTQLPQILSSSNEEKICLCVAALKVHMHVFVTLQTILLKDQSASNELSVLILNTLSANVSQNVGRGNQRSHSVAGKKQLLDFLGGHGSLEKTENTLDEIELPPHINARNLGTVQKKKDTLRPLPKTSLAKRLDLDIDSAQPAVQLFGSTYSNLSENAVQSLAVFLGEHCHANIEPVVASMIAEFPREDKRVDSLASRSVALWLANSVYKCPSGSAESASNFDIDEFLKFDNEDSNSSFEADPDEETTYLLLQTAQDLLGDTQSALEEANYDPRSFEYTICENAFSVALESIGLLASRLSKPDFQADVLMDYLYPLLEALTYTPDSRVHIQAKNSIRQIAQAHFGGSLERLVNANADYLIDSLSMRLSVSSGLSPSLPGILLVVIRISGTDLLLSNQLQDILSEIFIVIDSFHGYSLLVENFFHVFQELVGKVRELYGSQLSDESKLQSSENVSPYAPWGLKTTDQLLSLIDDANKLVDPFADYEPGKEYFRRKPGMPFGEQVDSDDEEDEEGEKENTEGANEGTSSESSEPWPSPVPKNIYASIQQVFTYGLQLLSHPSVKLRLQILQTLKDAYGIMSSCPRSLMPILAQYWPLLLVLATGSTSLSQNSRELKQLQGNQTHQDKFRSSSSQTDQLIAPALELMLLIFVEDAKHEKFMASRFIDTWSFMKKRISLISRILDGNDTDSNSTVSLSRSASVLPTLYCRLFVTGITVYERAVPDLVAHEMVKVCFKLGLGDSTELSRDVRNHLWVISHHHSRTNIPVKI